MSTMQTLGPTEFSFNIWMNSFLESSHPVGTNPFYKFVKTACHNNAKNWKQRWYVEKRILEKYPDYPTEKLDIILDKFEILIEFNSVLPYPRGLQLGPMDRDGMYHQGIEKNGKYFEKKVG